MLSEWAVMASSDGLVVNYYGPGRVTGRLRDELMVTLECDSDYPVGGRVRLRVEPAEPREFVLGLRIPAWASEPRVGIGARAPRHRARELTTACVEYGAAATRSNSTSHLGCGPFPARSRRRERFRFTTVRCSWPMTSG